MSDAVAKLKPVVLALPETDRCELIAALVESLPNPTEPGTEVDTAFNATLKRRLEELETGKVKGVPAEEVMERLRLKYQP